MSCQSGKELFYVKNKILNEWEVNDLENITLNKEKLSKICNKTHFCFLFCSLFDRNKILYTKIVRNVHVESYNCDGWKNWPPSINCYDSWLRKVNL